MKILHLTGSQTSEYYHGVSTMYAPGCIGNLPNETHMILLAHLNGMWSLPVDLSEESMEKSEQMTLPRVLVKLSEGDRPDIMQPHMFCYHGMVTCREIATLLDIPILGSPGSVMALSTDKWQTRAVVGSVGVPVPKGQLLRVGDVITMTPPFILKPCREDNSLGITFVEDISQVEAALATAFQFDDLIICEDFIPLGRELRVGVVDSEDGTSLEMLPCMEYFLDKKPKPIRTSADKIDVSSDGKLDFAPVDRACPAVIDEELNKKLYDLATKSHHAIGCQHYSLYDVRVDPNGNPYFIEASPYCSFSPKSAVVCMSRGNPAYNDTDLFYRLANQAIASFRTIHSDNNLEKQSTGMKRR